MQTYIEFWLQKVLGAIALKENHTLFGHAYEHYKKVRMLDWICISPLYGLPPYTYVYGHSIFGDHLHKFAFSIFRRQSVDFVSWFGGFFMGHFSAVGQSIKLKNKNKG